MVLLHQINLVATQLTKEIIVIYAYSILYMSDTYDDYPCMSLKIPLCPEWSRLTDVTEILDAFMLLQMQFQSMECLQYFKNDIHYHVFKTRTIS